MDAFIIGTALRARSTKFLYDVLEGVVGLSPGDWAAMGGARGMF